MKKSAVAIAAIALSVGLVGCGSDSKSKETTTEAATTTTTNSAEATTTAQASGPNQTIDAYLQQNNIQKTPISRGAAGAPTIDLPMPDGWRELEESEDASYGGIEYTTPTDPANPPRIFAMVVKLTGDVNADELLAASAAEFKKMPGFEGGDGDKDELGGYPAYQIGGTITENGALRLVAQKTVVIAVPDGTYVLQLDASGPDADSNALMDATATIDEKTTITP